jgi:hypothetical protein
MSKKVGTKSRTFEVVKKKWVVPKVEEITFEEIVDLAEVKIAFANTSCSGDLQ